MSRFPDEPQGPTQPEPDGSPAEAFRDAARQVAELREYANYYLTARLDSVKLSLRRAVIYGVLGAAGALAGATLLVSALVLLCWGCAGAYAAIFDIWWVGYLLMAASLLLVMGIGTPLALAYVRRSMRRATIRKYELRQREERAQYGHSVYERANYPQTASQHD